MTFTRFLAGPRWLCVDRTALRGVVSAPEMSAVPDAPPWIPGAYNRLGRAVAVIDTALLLGLGRAAHPPVCLLLVEGPAGVLGLMSDAEPDEVSTRSTPRRGSVIELVDRPQDLLRVDIALLEQRIEAALADLSSRGV